MGKSLKGKELGEGISQQANGSYCARFVDKFGKRRSKRSKSLSEVKQWMAEELYLDAHTDIKRPQDMTVDAWFQHWIGVKEKTVRPNTVRGYTERYENNICPVIGKMLLKDVKPIHIQEILTKMAEEGYRSTTITQTKIAAHGIFEDAKENDIIFVNPCKKSVKSNIGKPSPTREALTKDVQRKFLKAINNRRYENQYKFVLQTGLRTGEMVGLKWSDVDFNQRILSIARTMEYNYKKQMWMVGEPKSKSGCRKIPLTDEAIRILKNQKERNCKLTVIDLNCAEYVFLNAKGQLIKNSAYDTYLYKLCHMSGIKPFSMHILRHTFATRCIEGGMKPKTLQKILGHSNIKITMDLYVHITEDEKKREIELVSDVLNVV